MKNHKFTETIVILLLLFSTATNVIAFNHGAPVPKNDGLKVVIRKAIATIHPAKSPEPHITLMFTGDINLGRCVAKAAAEAGDFTYPFHFVAEKLRTADITVGSLDSTISNESPSMDCPTSMNLIGPENMVQGLQFAGFDIVSVAANHIKDCGEKGFNCNEQAFMDTLNILSTNGIKPVGGGENLKEARMPVVLESQGIRFAFLGLDQIDKRVWANENNPGVAPLSAEKIDQIKNDISAARKIADVVIVLPHWGVEYMLNPEEYQRAWAKELIDAGATLIVGNHAHIVQSMDVFPNGVAYYALGNFVFDQDQAYRREGIVVQVDFVGSQIESWKLLPIHINYFTYQPSWADGPIANKIFDRAIQLHP